jgi:hypothetical protein
MPDFLVAKMAERNEHWCENGTTGAPAAISVTAVKSDTTPMSEAPDTMDSLIELPLASWIMSSFTPLRSAISVFLRVCSNCAPTATVLVQPTRRGRRSCALAIMGTDSTCGSQTECIELTTRNHDSKLLKNGKGVARCEHAGRRCATQFQLSRGLPRPTTPPPKANL